MMTPAREDASPIRPLPDADRIEVTPAMVAAGADALEYVNDIGRWQAESLATSVLERALEARRQSLRGTPADRDAGPPCQRDAEPGQQDRSGSRGLD